MNQQLDFAALVQTYQAGVWRYLRALGCDHALADDLTQEVFLAVYRHPFEQRDEASTRAYLRTVAHNLFISAIRKRHRELDQSGPDVDAITEDWEQLSRDDDGETAKQALRECLGQLQEHTRIALDMQFRNQASRVNIAEALKMTEDGVKTLLRRARQQLRACMERRLGI